MGWIILLALDRTQHGGAPSARRARAPLTASAAALLLGAAGYALQGSPDLPGAPRSRHRGARYLSADRGPPRLLRSIFARGKLVADVRGACSNWEQRGCGRNSGECGKALPGYAQLWVGLGNALVDHARGITPAAELAYKRAEQISPGYPAPPFFYGLALGAVRRPGRRRSSYGETFLQKRAEGCGLATAG